MQILFAVHNDDEALWTAFLVQRTKPIVCIVTDSHIQPNRGDVGCTTEIRRAETDAAMKILCAPVTFLGIRDDEITGENFRQALEQRFSPDTPVYLPALQGGNPHHDIVSRVGSEFFNDVTYYATYAKGEHFTPIGDQVLPTLQEERLKAEALACYKSQLNLPSTRPHFKAVKNQCEYLLKRC
jgi:LmbE family N-acetylglucosaminyl deacetylase